jgi:DNA-binding transcriptional LysR family regulator
MLQNVVNLPRRGRSRARTHLKTRQLTFLLHLDNERCLARAAVAAGITQPAASKLLRQIEIALDTRLFERQARGMVPTCHGEILIRHARAALSELELAGQEIAAHKSGAPGKATVGAVLSRGTHLVTRAIARMKQHRPGIQVNIIIDDGKVLVRKLSQGDLDMLVGRLLEFPRGPDFSYEPLGTDEPCAVVARAGHPLAGRAGLELEDLLEQPWILPPTGALERDKLEELFLQPGLSMPDNVVESASMPAITSLLQLSDTVVALPESAVESYCRAGILTVLVRKLPLQMGALGLITRRHHRLSSGAQLLLATVRELAGRGDPS